MKLQSAGESAIIAYLGETSSAEVSAQVQTLGAALRVEMGSRLVDLTPSYASLLVSFDPLQIDHFQVGELIRACFANLESQSLQPGKLIEIPVYYHPDSGEDLLSLAEAGDLAWEEVVAIHSAQEYRVYAIGFAPGFAYLGDVDERIAAPRQSTPRQRVPRGAVAIADRQTAVYPAESPGGWNLIGRSPLRMFDPSAAQPMPVAVGDRVRFRPIEREAFLSAGGALT
ncbi:MAG: 5-oxoprolinase subunit PxpB [Pseudomonadota bacterium]